MTMKSNTRIKLPKERCHIICDVNTKGLGKFPTSETFKGIYLNIAC